MRNQKNNKTSKSKPTQNQKVFDFYNSTLGHLVLLAIIWVIGFNLFLLAVDSGSLLQWGGVLVCLFWGFYHLIESLMLFIKKVWPSQNKKA